MIVLRIDPQHRDARACPEGAEGRDELILAADGVRGLGAPASGEADGGDESGRRIGRKGDRREAAGRDADRENVMCVDIGAGRERRDRGLEIGNACCSSLPARA